MREWNQTEANMEIVMQAVSSFKSIYSIIFLNESFAIETWNYNDLTAYNINGSKESKADKRKKQAKAE